MIILMITIKILFYLALCRYFYECLDALAADLDDSYLRGDAIRDKSVGSEFFFSQEEMLCKMMII